MSKIQTPLPIRGMQSMLGEEADRFAHVVATFDRVRRLYGFRRVEVPVLEPTAVFARTMGETTDVVSKEMYSFEDRSGDQVTLRPEFTAGIARAYLSEGWQQYAPLKVATHGPAFRYERPQKGPFPPVPPARTPRSSRGRAPCRRRIARVGAQLLAELGIKGVKLQLNTLGDAASREAWRAALVDHFSSHRAELSDDSKVRLDKNPLRILDSKDPRDRPFVDAAPAMVLTPEADDFFAAVRAGLDAAGVAMTSPAARRASIISATRFESSYSSRQGNRPRRRSLRTAIEQLSGPHTRRRRARGSKAGCDRHSRTNSYVTVIPVLRLTKSRAIFRGSSEAT